MRLVLFAGLSAVLIASPPWAAFAESDTLKPLTTVSLPKEFTHSLNKLSVHEPVSAAGCLPGSTDKPTVCSFKIGGFMGVMASTDKGSSELTALTLMCIPQNDMDSAKCLAAFVAALDFAGGEANKSDKSKILKTLMEGIDLAKEITISNDDRKFVLQKSLGLWLHVIAVDSQQAQ